MTSVCYCPILHSLLGRACALKKKKLRKHVGMTVCFYMNKGIDNVEPAIRFHSPRERERFELVGKLELPNMYYVRAFWVLVECKKLVPAQVNSTYMVKTTAVVIVVGRTARLASFNPTLFRNKINIYGITVNDPPVNVVMR